MLRAIKRALAGVCLDPDNEIFRFAIDLFASSQDFALMSPIHEDEVNCTIDRMLRREREGFNKKTDVLCFGQLAGGSDEFAMLDSASALD